MTLDPARRGLTPASEAAPDADTTDARVGDGPLRSALYVGHLRHRRHLPVAHAFRYRVFHLLLDLDELDRVFAGRWFWSVGRPNLMSFRRADYLGPPEMDLASAVRARIAAEGLPVPRGPIRLLTHLRSFGYVQNPVSFYYCYEQDRLHTIVAEITNTPWGERHAYVLPLADGETRREFVRFRFDKGFHVSPFLPMDCQYDWRFSDPGETLNVHMLVRQNDVQHFDATLTLARAPITGWNLARALFLYPPITFATLLRIYWHALLIWLRRNPFYPHPKLRSGDAPDLPHDRNQSHPPRDP